MTSEKLIKRIMKLRIENGNSLSAIAEVPIIKNNMEFAEIEKLYNQLLAEQPVKAPTTISAPDKPKQIRQTNREPFFKKLSFWISKETHDKIIAWIKSKDDSDLSISNNCRKLIQSGIDEVLKKQNGN